MAIRKILLALSLLTLPPAYEGIVLTDDWVDDNYLVARAETGQKRSIYPMTDILLHKAFHCWCEARCIEDPILQCIMYWVAAEFRNAAEAEL